MDIDEEDLQHAAHDAVPLVKDKIIVQARVNGGRAAGLHARHRLRGDGASRARPRSASASAPITYTLSAGVGEVGLRGLQLARIKSLDFGTLQVRNLPVLIKNPALRGIPKREGESFSPLSLGMSMMIDYQKRLLTIGRELPAADADYHAADARPPPGDGARRAQLQLPDLLRRRHRRRGDLDQRRHRQRARRRPRYRRIPLRVWGTSGWDRDAFLLPGNDLDFDRIEYRNFPLVVLNLRAPSVLLGFQVGGIVGHKFLSNYRVSMDLERSELRLEKF